MLPRLDNTPYDLDILADGLPAEAARLQRCANSDGDDESMPPSGPAAAGRAETTGRAPISKQGRVSSQALQRILNSTSEEPEFMTDRTKLRQLRKENAGALTKWLQTHRHEL
ncbi:hypothetical protein PR003_g26416 [Phytophthora rubi]|uniref:Uncharacterized protein n=1 Tax=Phytophthora rubi TaxID=129364 RepID=A0A6A3IQ45_9STRA|nr:hypothetical protein PR002_g23399 [Phytophthora rubi]KAE8986921.1 hypothetical protein PR001_g22469 [Phytophthora rubi]KAE9286072.1 hypothetical protein PR003_g26416 [Phytophthora rubi]